MQNCMVYAHNCNNVHFCTNVHTLYTKSTYIIYNFCINIQNVCIFIQYIQNCKIYPYILTIFLHYVILQPKKLGPQPNRVCGRHGHTCQYSSASRGTQEQQEKARRLLHFHRLKISLQYYKS
jgi:hypothetical protein